VLAAVRVDPHEFAVGVYGPDDARAGVNHGRDGIRAGRWSGPLPQGREAVLAVDRVEGWCFPLCRRLRTRPGTSVLSGLPLPPCWGGQDEPRSVAAVRATRHVRLNKAISVSVFGCGKIRVQSNPHERLAAQSAPAGRIDSGCMVVREATAS